MHDEEIIEGLVSGGPQRTVFENELYSKYNYFINEGCRKYNISSDDSFSAYSDAVLSVIHNVLDKSFASRSSLKTYLFKIFNNK